MQIARIQPLRLGQTNCYLLGGAERYVLVDAGPPGKARRFFQMIDYLGIAPEQIKLVVVTHVHYDHVGSLAEIVRRCQCSVMVHEREAALLHRGEVVFPPACTTIGRLALCFSRCLRPFMNFEPVTADIIVGSDTPLGAFGLPGGLVRPTPGHTDGSVSILWDEAACVGDLMMHMLPMQAHDPVPFFANDIDKVYESWSKLIRTGARVFYPGHGKPIQAADVRERFSEPGGAIEGTPASESPTAS